MATKAEQENRIEELEAEMTRLEGALDEALESASSSTAYVPDRQDPVKGWEDDELKAGVELALKPFPPENVGKLPRKTCRDCTNYKPCSKHGMVWGCAVCGNNHTSATIHLDYVGHAEMTAALLRFDPLWNWEPVAFDESGLPRIHFGESQCVLWIRLTVRGVTRLGVGTAPRSKEEIHKELIGDALRNAAMRFGFAVDLWSKSENLDAIGFNTPAPAPAPAPEPQAAPEAVEAPKATETAEDAPSAPESPDPDTPAQPASSDADREQMIKAMLTLDGKWAKQARDRLNDHEPPLWPVTDVPDELVEKASGILADVWSMKGGEEK